LTYILDRCQALGVVIDPISHPVWAVRAKELATLMVKPLTPAEVIKVAGQQLHWTPGHTTQVLAAGEGQHFHFRDGHWQRAYIPTARRDRERPAVSIGSSLTSSIGDPSVAFAATVAEED